MTKSESSESFLLWRLVGGALQRSQLARSLAQWIFIAMWSYRIGCFELFIEGLAGHEDQKYLHGTEGANVMANHPDIGQIFDGRVCDWLPFALVVYRRRGVILYRCVSIGEPLYWPAQHAMCDNWTMLINSDQELFSSLHFPSRRDTSAHKSTRFFANH